MVEEKRIVELTPFEYRLLINGMSNYRNDLIDHNKSTEDVSDMILKIIDAPKKKLFGRDGREAR
jgi:hypothetical protein